MPEFFHLFNLLRLIYAVGILLFIAGFWFEQLLLLIIGSILIALATIVSKFFWKQANEAMLAGDENFYNRY